VTTNIRDNRFPYLEAEQAQALTSLIYRYRAQGDYELLGFVIMPDHLHLLVVPQNGVTISSIMNRIKTAEAKRLISCGLKPPIWWRRFYDRIMRDEDMLLAVLNYMQENPVRKEMVKEASEYSFSSANPRWETDLSKYFD
jgi:putative transposase